MQGCGDADLKFSAGVPILIKWTRLHCLSKRMLNLNLDDFMKFDLFKTFLWVSIFSALPVCSLYAADNTSPNISWALLFFSLLGGLALFLYGMEKMSEGMRPLRTYASFVDFLRRLEHPLIGILAGTLFTAIVQSSAAFAGILIVLAQQGLITLEASIAMIYGANIGTCITAGLASIGTAREAKRVALAHVVFKLVGVALFFFWIPEFAELIRSLALKFGSGTARHYCPLFIRCAEKRRIFSAAFAHRGH